jgi:hypothetical protein
MQNLQHRLSTLPDPVLESKLTDPFDHKMIRLYLAEAAAVVIDIVGEDMVLLIDNLKSCQP